MLKLLFIDFAAIVCFSCMKMSSEVDFFVRYEAFQEWLSKRGFTPLMHLKIVDFPVTGRGVMCTRDIDSGETVVSIPKTLLVSTDTVLNCSALGPHIKAFAGEAQAPRLPPLHVLSTFLMCERLRGYEESPWSPYLAILPSSYTTPPFLPTHHLSLFQPHVQKRIRVLKETIKWEYERVRPFLVYLSRWYGTGVTRFPLFRWAWFTVNTRAVYLRPNTPKCPFLNEEVDCCALAPFLDFLNHSSRARVKAGLNESTGTYDVITLDPVSAGDQVFISYGSHDNLTLLLDYGFVLAKNPHSCVHFESSDIWDCFERILGTTLRSVVETDDLCCTWDGPSWNLLELLRKLLRRTNEDPEANKILTKRLLRDLMSNRLKMTLESKDCLGRHSVSLALSMSCILIDEEMDILNLHLSELNELSSCVECDEYMNHRM